MNPLSAQIDVNGVWKTCFFIGTTLGVLYLIKPYTKRIGLAAAALLAYTLIYALYLIEYPGLPFDVYNTAYQATAGSVFAEVCVITLLALHSPKWIFKLIPVVAVIELLLIITDSTGLMIAQSFDLAFVALCIPFLPHGLIAATLVVIATHHGATAQLIVAAQASAFALKNKRFRPYFIGVVICIMGVAYFHSYSAWFDGSERVTKWRQMLEIWAESWDRIVFGVGPGTFMWQSLEADHWKTPSYGLYLQMHSDWLQILFELGLVGLGLSVAVVYRTIRNAWNDTEQLAAVLGAVAFALTYHPLRFFPPAFLTALIFSCRKKSNSPHL